MRVYPERLAQHIASALPPLVWVAGDDPLLVQEACDTVRETAAKQGFAERKVFHAEKAEHWQAALAEANALSLFADRSLIDIRSAAGKLEHAALLAYLERPNPDSLVLVQTGKVESASTRTQWFKALEQACSYVPVMPLDTQRFPQWLGERARRKQLNLPADALQVLITHTEGNLLAAVQELDKLALQFGNAPVTADQVSASVADSAHYDVFALNDALLAGDAAQALRVLHALRAEGGNPLAILGALGRELRQLATAAEDIDQGKTAQAVIRQLGVWEKRQPLFSRALQRLRTQHTRRMIHLLAQVDLATKGMLQRQPWDLLEDLCLLLCQPAGRR